MIRTGPASLLLWTAFYSSALFAQGSPGQEPADLKVELRTSTGSNRFQLGEIIPLEVLISSSTPNRYLEPCTLFRESCFGYPRCRFFTRWSLDVIPETGRADIGWHGCGAMSGPIEEVQSSDLTAEPKKYSYTLTDKFRFDAPGKYTVRLSLTVGLDDDTNKIENSENSAVKHNSVSKTVEMVLEIVPAEEEWKRRVVAQGVVAWTAPLPAYSAPPSPEYLKHQEERDALCNLGTPEAAVALAGLLGKGIDVAHCLRNNSHSDVEEAEMGRLLVDPNTGVRPVFFAAYARLLGSRTEKNGEISGVPVKVVNEVRETLFASLPKKTPEAMIPSLDTVLRNPMNGYWVAVGSAYDQRDPYSTEIIATAAANFDHLPEQSQAALLDTDWDHLRSPLMLPVVRSKAEAGNGHALLRWSELDRPAAEAFIRQEIVRPAPRFSSLYLRLTDESLPAQEQQIAANFVALSAPKDLIRAATLLERYTTRATLSTALPFIDQHLTEWPCNVQIPVLAYLLKVSPEEATPRVQQVLSKVRPPYCPRGEFFPSFGLFLQASPVLDTLAARQVENGTPLAADAVGYLERYGSPAMKPEVWEQLSRWHKKYEESGAQLRMESQNSMQSGTQLRMEGQNSEQDDWQLYNLDSKLLAAYVNARGWTLSLEDVVSISKLIGDKKTKELACAFSCGSEISPGTAPGNYYIYGRANDPVPPSDARIDYLMPSEQFRYSVNQYKRMNLKALEQKLLQFPAGSIFSVARTGDPHDGQGDWAEIGPFLKSHGYSFKD
ncbi:hypothetical protein [Terracidiphilus gabretensis]|jgi:hypothetical protein|uniref:hypothetical protein n=1 Tax=Terracidiphilus gabretensis TaxID=1577687 RepID=UPI00071BFB64|nr:hypothetical protein [Terracidiphilus gabretensis]